MKVFQQRHLWRRAILDENLFIALNIMLNIKINRLPLKYFLLLWLDSFWNMAV